MYDRLKRYFRAHAKLKGLVLYLLMPRNQKRPRRWVQLLLNPLKHKKGKRSLIRKRTRMDVMPFHDFILGDDTTVEDFSTINNGMGAVVIGSRCRVGISNVLIGPVEIGNDVIIAQNVVMSGLNHSYQDVSVPIRQQACSVEQIVLQDEVWVGANVVITAGVVIGKHAVVAAGSVVTKHVEPYSVVAGNPARVIKRYNPVSRKWEKVNYAKNELAELRRIR